MVNLPRPQPSPFRRHWSLAPGIVFLNHGAFGACPIPILERQTELRRQMEAEPVQFLWRRYEERLEPSRSELANFVGARPQDVVFTSNATAGVNAVVRSLRLTEADEILTTSFDYNACHNVLIEAQDRTGAKVVTAQLPFPLRSGEEIVNAVLSAVTSKTKLVLLDHITSDTGLIFPIERLIREFDARGIETLIDGAHAPGTIPLNLNALRPTYYAANLHKWVCAPKGAAFLWVREDCQEKLQPPVISHGNSRTRPGYSQFQDRFDWPGTFDPTSWMCVGDAIRWCDSLVPGGWDELRQTRHALVVKARRQLCADLSVEPPCPEEMLGTTATIPLPDRFQTIPPSGKLDVEQMRLYDEFGIEVPLIRKGDPSRRWFRVSAQIYNTEAEYRYLAAAIQAL